MEDAEEALRELENKRDALIAELESLEKAHEKGDLSNQEYSEKRKKLERELVETMDRIVQLEFLTGRRRVLRARSGGITRFEEPRADTARTLLSTFYR